MALTEQRILQSVTLKIQSQSIEVLWHDQILRDGEVVSSVPFRCAYGPETLQQYLTDMAQYPTAPHAIAALGLSMPA